MPLLDQKMCRRRTVVISVSQYASWGPSGACLVAWPCHKCGWSAWALRADEGTEAVRSWSRMVKDDLRRRVMLWRGGGLGGKEVPVWACFFLRSWGEVAFSVLCLFFSCDLMHSVCLNGCKMNTKSSNKFLTFISAPPTPKVNRRKGY